MARKDGNCTAASFQSEPSSWTLSPLAWHNTQKYTKIKEAPTAHVPSSLLSGQLPYPQNLYTSWVEQAAHVPRVCSCLPILPTLSLITWLTTCLPVGARQLHLSISH